MNMLAKYNRPMTPREKRIRNQFGAMFIIATLTALWLMVMCSNQSIEIKDVSYQRDSLMRLTDSLKAEGSYKDSLLTKKGITALINQRDSLISELFVCNVQLQRWESAFEIFKEREPKPAQRFGLIYNHETE